jgi:hypothetical protein
MVPLIDQQREIVRILEAIIKVVQICVIFGTDGTDDKGGVKRDFAYAGNAEHSGCPNL